MSADITPLGNKVCECRAIPQSLGTSTLYAPCEQIDWFQEHGFEIYCDMVYSHLHDTVKAHYFVLRKDGGLAAVAWEGSHPEILESLKRQLTGEEVYKPVPWVHNWGARPDPWNSTER